LPAGVISQKQNNTTPSSASPAAGFGMIVKKIAERAKAEQGGQTAVS
jgi:hypothetical protein